ncbi:putative nuclease HARBI1 [Musca domestica]|uniref:Putative nuclease HARBI1 n=1 Tax=Musca domestica TaxID=7370 RepID=A0A9J7DI32_MUSDO|nr:putative nuclease HARBI1 [Musca domestica]
MSSSIILYYISQRHRIEQRNSLRILRRSLRDHHNPFEIATEESFFELYRMPKHLCLELIEELKPFLPKSRRVHAIPCHLIVLSSLRFFATGSFQRSVGQDNLSALSQTSVSRCVTMVAKALNNISHNYIIFPKQEDFPGLKIKFMEKYQFPGIIGVIDGTHIKMSAPRREIEHIYYCRKGGHSKNVMIICDSNYIILAANARFGGTAHDSYVWRSSQACRRLEDLYTGGDRNYWLLGDSGYPLQPWLMTPILSTCNTSEERYNIAHKSTRALVERCIGILKSRFRCLSKERTLYYSPPKAGLIINACLVLHNFLVRKKIPHPEIISEEMNDNGEQTNATADISCRNISSIAKRQRSEIVENVFAQ